MDAGADGESVIEPPSKTFIELSFYFHRTLLLMSPRDQKWKIPGLSGPALREQDVQTEDGAGARNGHPGESAQPEYHFRRPFLGRGRV